MQNEESHPPRPADAKTLLPTRGFTLSSLFQVIEFRSTVDTKISSLHFILAKLLASMPEVGLEKLPTEMEAVVAAAKASDEALDGAALYIAEEVVFLQTQIQKAKKGCKTEQQRGEGGEQNAAAEALSVEGESLAEPPLLGEKELDRLRHIHGEASFHWQELKERYSQTKEAVTALSRFFGEEPKRPSASALPSPFLLAQGWGGVVAASPFALLTNILKAVKNVLKDLQLHPRRYAVLLSSKGQPTPNNNEASHGPREGLEGLNKGLETSPPCSNPPPEIAETKAEHPAKSERRDSEGGSRPRRPRGKDTAVPAVLFLGWGCCAQCDAQPAAPRCPKAIRKQTEPRRSRPRRVSKRIQIRLRKARTRLGRRPLFTAKPRPPRRRSPQSARRSLMEGSPSTPPPQKPQGPLVGRSEESLLRTRRPRSPCALCSQAPLEALRLLGGSEESLQNQNQQKQKGLCDTRRWLLFQERLAASKGGATCLSCSSGARPSAPSTWQAKSRRRSSLHPPLLSRRPPRPNAKRKRDLPTTTTTTLRLKRKGSATSTPTTAQHPGG